MKTEFIQKLILMIAKWRIQYVYGYHVAKNGGKRKKEESITSDSII